MTTREPEVYDPSWWADELAKALDEISAAHAIGEPLLLTMRIVQGVEAARLFRSARARHMVEVTG